MYTSTVPKVKSHPKMPLRYRSIHHGIYHFYYFSIFTDGPTEIGTQAIGWPETPRVRENSDTERQGGTGRGKKEMCTHILYRYL